MGKADRSFTVDLRGLSEGRHELTLVEPGSSLDLPGDMLTIEGDVTLDLVLSLTGRVITARGTVRTEPEMTCARCLEPFTDELEASFEIVLRAAEGGIELEDEEDTPAVVGEDWVAFDLSVREALLLAMPMKPLCRPDCKGLCPRCGTNLNESTCDCAPEPADSRWEELRSLLEEE